jgi:hypothetical protein
VCELEGRLATPDDPPAPGSPAVCGGCASFHLLEPELLDGEWVPRLRRPRAPELLELLGRPELRAIRDAYALDQMEGRMRAAAAKPKPSPPRTAGRVRLGPNRLEARGPGA